jgi:hypothetical protein
VQRVSPSRPLSVDAKGGREGGAFVVIAGFKPVPGDDEEGRAMLEEGAGGTSLLLATLMRGVSWTPEALKGRPLPLTTSRLRIPSARASRVDTVKAEQYAQVAAA